ncbi:MAG: hypothetical protein WAO20_07115 [Acidobacteriota bacterium]
MLKRCSLVLVFLFAVPALPVFAQDGVQLGANIPFPFIVEGKTFPSGEYQFWQLSANNDSDWQIRDVKQGGQNQAMFETEPTESPDPAQTTALTFRKIGDHYYLADLWAARGEWGWHVPVKLELKEMAKKTKAAFRKVPATIVKPAAR